jgi:hypothetical protein
MISNAMRWTLSLVFWIALALVLISLFKKNRGSANVRSTGEVEFAARWWFLCSWLFIIVRFAFMGFDYLKAGLKEPVTFATGALICIAVMGSVLILPRALVVTNEALEEVHWFWPKKRLAWTEIEEIDTEKRGSAVTLKGSRRSKIVYTNIYPDRPRFLLEIKRHCGNDLPSNFPIE